MEGHTEYKTRQKERVLAYMRSLDGEHITISALSKKIADGGDDIGTTTLYRCLNRLVEEGSVKRYVVESGRSACFQYIGEGSTCEHYHLRCKKCGRLLHMDCDEIEKLKRHVKKEHDFDLDLSETVFQGICGDCGKGEAK